MSPSPSDPAAPAPPLTFGACVERLRAGLAGSLPGTEAHLRMAPEYRKQASLLTVEGKACREAAVLVLIVEMDGAPSVVLTLRHAHLAHHPGQISFPGGRREPGESLEAAALREANEEVGLFEPVEVLGGLSPLYIPPSNFCVYPSVAARERPPALLLQEAEVEAILYVPLSRLLLPDARRRAQRDVRGALAWVPFFEVDGHEIWGATAMILSELLALLERPGR